MSKIKAGSSFSRLLILGAMRQVGSKPVPGLLSLVAGQLAAPPVMILARWVENALDVPVQGSHDADPKSFVACSIEQRALASAKSTKLLMTVSFRGASVTNRTTS
jgi:hypothetical protein